LARLGVANRVLNQAEDIFPARFFALFRTRNQVKHHAGTENGRTMNQLIQFNRVNLLFIIVLLLACFGFSPDTRAISPPPDGGYPGGNTAEGQNALLSLTTGGYNTAVGFLSLRSNTTNSFNTAVGAGALLANTADSNTAIGAAALLSNTTGTDNTANGTFALFSNNTGFQNTANGWHALASNTSGNYNTATGLGALENNTADNNTADGINALLSNTTGSQNTASGGNTLLSNTVGVSNTASGYQALNHNTIGGFNTAVGAGALFANTTGSFNVALGFQAGSEVTMENNVICIGTTGLSVSNTCFIGSIRNVTTQANDAIPVLIDSNSQLGTISSSARFKKDIKPMDKASETILAFKPVTFHYRSDKTNRPEYGLIAEEVANVNPDLVVRDKNGAIYTVRYDAVNAMLLNEFLKEHRHVQEQDATIRGLQKQVEVLSAGLQKVSARLEVSKPAPETALNN
jgi:hypothetical protein